MRSQDIEHYERSAGDRYISTVGMTTASQILYVWVLGRGEYNRVPTAPCHKVVLGVI